MLGHSTITDNPVKVTVDISKGAEGWKIQPSLTAFPSTVPRLPSQKNTVFLLDCSESMKNDGRLGKVKSEVSDWLDKLKPSDTFSIISFFDRAEVLVTHAYASDRAAINEAKAIVNSMTAGGQTNFREAFRAVNNEAIIPPGSNSAILFLTDGEHYTEEDSEPLAPSDLLKPFSRAGALPRIIPIGICLDEESKGGQFLSKLGGGSTIFIQGAAPVAYQDAFQKAHAISATELSRAPAQLAMTIKANGAPDSTMLAVTRELSHVHYDGSSPITTLLHFDSRTPPVSLELNISCDGVSLHAEYELTRREHKNLGNNEPVHVDIRNFKSKPLSAAAAAAPAAAGGSGDEKRADLPGRRQTVLDQQQTGRFSQFSCRGILAGGMFAVGGATAGYFGGTAASTTSFAIATGISASLFVAACTVAGAVMLPLLAYACWRSKRFAAGSALAVGGAALGYFGGTAASTTSFVTAAGISASLCVAACTVAGAVMLPLLAAYCIQNNNAASKQPKRRFA